jgi:uncharacterized protein
VIKDGNGNDVLVVDGVVHAYNLTEENLVGEATQRFRDGVYHHHELFSAGGEYLLRREQFLADFAAESLLEAVFAESQVDLAVYHAVPLFDFFKDGVSALHKGLEMKRKHPDRVLVYGTVNALDRRFAVEQARQQIVEQGVDGIKLYPATFYDGATAGWRMDDPAIAFPLFDAMLELGVRNVAIHKAMPLGPLQTSPFHVDDLAGAAANYPEMNFQIVHGGFAFIEETSILLHRFPNISVNLEATAAFVANRPRQFAAALGEFLYWGSAEQVIFATGCNLAHPKPLVDAFWDFEMPEVLRDEFGYPEVTPEMKAKMLGGNLAALHDIDPATRIAAIEGDEYGRIQRAGDFAEPWSGVRELVS